MNQGHQGFQNPQSGANEFNAMTFLVKQILSTMHTATLVQVMQVTNIGTVAPVGTVDVQPLVNQLDGFGNAVPHGRLYKLPYSRVQGGSNAVILDPQVGDIGIAVFAERDISNIEATKKQGNPGSARKFDMADGVYVATLWAQTPTRYIQFSGSGLNITAPDAITLTVGAHALIINTSGITIDGKPFLTHTHTGVQTGTGVSGPVA